MSLHRGPAPRGRYRRAGWAAGAAVALGLAVAVATQATGGTACAAAAVPRAAIPTGTGFRTGIATFYGNDPVAGACSYVEKAPGGYTTALGPVEYAAGAACGMSLEVKGRKGTVRVTVTNLCPECPPGHLDLTNEAFAKVDDLAKGRVAISYRVVDDPPLPGPLTVRVKEGSSQWWLALLLDRHGNALRSVELATTGGAWKPLSRTDYNYWLAPSGAGRGPFTVRVTDVRGHRATLRGIALKPGVVQRTTVPMYPSAAAAPAPAVPSTARTTPVSRSATRTATAAPTPGPPSAPAGTAGTVATAAGATAAPAAAPSQAGARCG